MNHLCQLHRTGSSFPELTQKLAAMTFDFVVVLHRHPVVFHWSTERVSS